MTGRTVLAALLAATLTSAACGTSQQDVPLRVRARSGAVVDLSETTWEVCRDTPSSGGSFRWREVHGDKGVVTIVVTPYAAAGCTGDPGANQSIAAIAHAEGDRPVGFVGTPPAGVTPPVTATRVYLDAGSFGFSLDCYWVDDTVSPRVLYTGDPTSTIDARGFPDDLVDQGEQEK